MTILWKTFNYSKVTVIRFELLSNNLLLQKGEAPFFIYRVLVVRPKVDINQINCSIKRL